MTIERKIKQILFNLIDNGIKYNKTDGLLTVTVSKIEGGVSPTSIVMVAEDTGKGITPEDQANLFKPFMQGSRNFTEPAEGTGLGLALQNNWWNFMEARFRWRAKLVLAADLSY